MTIISLSLNDRMLEELDRIQRDMGFSGRSEAIRAGIRTLLTDSKEKEAMTGRVVGVLLLIHGHEAENLITPIKHTFLDIIYTQIHNRFKEDKCLEVFILDGGSERVKELTQILQKNEKIEYVKLVIA